MLKIREEANCTAVRLFLWNEKLTRNQISDSEGLCMCQIRSTYMKKLQTWNFDYPNQIKEQILYTVIPFDLSKLLNKDKSLGLMLVSATLQFLPDTIKQLGDDISSYLFTQFEYSQAFLQPPPRPTYVIALEISHIRFLDFTDHIDHLNNVTLNLAGLPPPVPFYRRFEIDWDLKEDRVASIIDWLNDPYNQEWNEGEEPIVSIIDWLNDSYNGYSSDVLQYITILRMYTGEGGLCPTKPPISADVPRGIVEVQPSRCSRSCWCPNPDKELTDETCVVCHEEFQDKENEVIITTYCSHPFHAMCLLTWLSKKNTCPTCRAVYPLHYSPVLSRRQCD